MFLFLIFVFSLVFSKYLGSDFGVETGLFLYVGRLGFADSRCFSFFRGYRDRSCCYFV